MERELISKEIVCFDVNATTRESVIEFLAGAMEQDGRLINKSGYIQDVMTRESSSSTGIGFLVATPHAKSEHVKVPSLAFAKLNEKIMWDDREEVELVFQIAVPSPGQGDTHLQILSALFRRLVHDEFREKLKSSQSSEDVIQIIREIL